MKGEASLIPAPSRKSIETSGCLPKVRSPESPRLRVNKGEIFGLLGPNGSGTNRRSSSSSGAVPRPRVDRPVVLSASQRRTSPRTSGIRLPPERVLPSTFLNAKKPALLRPSCSMSGAERKKRLSRLLVLMSASRGDEASPRFVGRGLSKEARAVRLDWFCPRPHHTIPNLILLYVTPLPGCVRALGTAISRILIRDHHPSSTTRQEIVLSDHPLADMQISATALDPSPRRAGRSSVKAPTYHVQT